MSDIHETLNKQQFQAVTHDSGPSIVLAGAGSGKTKVLAHRVLWLMSEKQIAPSSIMVVTFTNKASSEMKSRILAISGQQLWQAGTFHSICAKILRQHGKSIGLSETYSIYDTNDQLKLIKDIMAENKIDPKKLSAKAILDSISSAKNELIDPNSYRHSSSSYRQLEIAKIYEKYQKHLEKSQAVDFDDLLSKTVLLLDLDEKVRLYFQEKIQHLLVDEYQDTNKAQYLLTKIIAQPNNNLFVVGDFSQSIYSWRGADYRNMMLLKQDFPEIKEYKLEQNYRSQQTILDAATQLISNNTRHPVLKLWTDQKNHKLINLHRALDQKSEAKYIAQQISKLKTGGVQLSEIAILYRTNAQSRMLEETLIKYGISYDIIGGTNFYERKEIKDLLSFLKILINPFDEINRKRAISVGKKRMMIFEKLVEQNPKLQEHKPHEILLKIIDATGYLKKFEKQSEENIQRIAYINELLSLSTQFENLTIFLENISLVQNNKLIDSQNDFNTQESQKVSLMSLHSAKGLEFEAVFMIGVEEGLLPHQRSIFDADQLEEERRLCYVGITRAKNTLYFTYVTQRYSMGSTSNSIHSRFISEIDPKLFKNGDSQTKNIHQSKNIHQYQKHYTSDHLKQQRRFVPLDDDLSDSWL